METTRRGGFGLLLSGGGGVGIALLGTLGAVAAGWLPWPALLVAWLGGNVVFVCALNARSADPPAHRSHRCIDGVPQATSLLTYSEVPAPAPSAR